MIRRGSTARKRPRQSPPRRRRWLVFCDEAGNTGTNHTDDSQPYFVLAGWIVDSDLVGETRRAIGPILRPSQPSQRELKGAELIRTPRGRHQILAVFEALGKRGALPFFVALRKRYSLAGRFVDYFLDPIHNPRVWKSWFGTREIRKRFADEITSVPARVLDRMQTVLRTGDVREAERLVVEIRDALAMAGNTPMAQKVEGVIGRERGAVEEILEKEGAKPKGLSPNLAAFATMLQILGGQAQALGYELVMVHDQTSAFEATFNECFEMHTGIDPNSDLGRELARATAVPLTSVSAVRFEESHGELIVQAADLLAATMCWMIRGDDPDARTGTEPAVRHFAMMVLAPLLRRDPRLAEIVESNAELGRLGERLRRVFEGETGIET